jgi:hypothetical protein
MLRRAHVRHLNLPLLLLLHVFHGSGLGRILRVCLERRTPPLVLRSFCLYGIFNAFSAAAAAAAKK